MGSLDMVEFYVYTYIQTHVPDWLGAGGRMGEGESRCILRKKVLKVYHDNSFNPHHQVRTDGPASSYVVLLTIVPEKKGIAQ